MLDSESGADQRRQGYPLSIPVQCQCARCRYVLSLSVWQIASTIPTQVDFEMLPIDFLYFLMSLKRLTSHEQDICGDRLWGKSHNNEIR